MPVGVQEMCILGYMAAWKKWRYKNLTIVFFGIVISFFLSKSPEFYSLLHVVTLWGGLPVAFLGGMLFVSMFTIGPGTLIITFLAGNMNPLLVAAVAGAGAVTSDFLMFQFVRNDLEKEILPLYKKLGGGHVYKAFHTKYFHWMLPVVGAIIIALPIPDELGVSLLGLSKMSMYEVIPLSYFLNTVGIIAAIGVSNLI
jgi:hypothetical protein